MYAVHGNDAWTWVVTRFTRLYEQQWKLAVLGARDDYTDIEFFIKDESIICQELWT